MMLSGWKFEQNSTRTNLPENLSAKSEFNKIDPCPPAPTPLCPIGRARCIEARLSDKNNLLLFRRKFFDKGDQIGILFAFWPIVYSG
jgi:hypothetical protein